MLPPSTQVKSCLPYKYGMTQGVHLQHLLITEVFSYYFQFEDDTANVLSSPVPEGGYVCVACTRSFSSDHS